MSAAYSEYLLYEPALRIATARGWKVRVEYPLASHRDGPGDRRRIDFMFTDPETKKCIALELKWRRRRGSSVSVGNDIEKLRSVRPKQGFTIERQYLMVVGRPPLETAVMMVGSRRDPGLNKLLKVSVSHEYKGGLRRGACIYRVAALPTDRPDNPS